MPIEHSIWKVGEKPVRLSALPAETESFLEQMIVQEPSILSDHWMLIGQQVRTDHAGFIDLLALNADGQIILIELKRDKTPREVVAQALDYASWVKSLTPDRIAAIYDGFTRGHSLDQDFEARFGFALDADQLNGSHQIFVVAASLDPSTERIVMYLNGMNVPVNVIFFQCFEDAGRKYLSRAWLLDPVETENRAASNSGSEPKGEWNGEFYVSFGHDENRDWEEARRYGFISAGRGTWYTRTLAQLSKGDRVWVNIPRAGYVGVGHVTGPVVRLNDFMVQVDGVERPFLEVAEACYHQDVAGDEELSEYFVPVEWTETRPVNAAVSEVGFFGNQNTVCKPRTAKWDHTIGRLKHYFGRAG